MAMNPLLAPNMYPQLFPSEIIVIIYPGVYGSLELDNGLRIRNPGTIFLTNARIVFVSRDPTLNRYNFALHLNLILQERVITISPTLAHYQGRVLPYGNYMPAPGKFGFEMTQDPRPLVNAISKFLTQIRSSNPNNPQTVPKSNENKAYVDPSDPDIIYLVEDHK
jgi:hypothetical protein